MKGSWRFLVDLQPLKGFCGSWRPQQRHLCLGCCSVGGPAALRETHLLTSIRLSLSKCPEPNPLVSSSSIPHFCFTKVHLKSASMWDRKWSILIPILSTSSISLPFFHHFPALLSSLILIASLSFSISSPPPNLVSLYTVLSGHSCYGWRKWGELWISKSPPPLITPFLPH